jgi:hypothetical protein
MEESCESCETLTSLVFIHRMRAMLFVAIPERSFKHFRGKKV